MIPGLDGSYMDNGTSLAHDYLTRHYSPWKIQMQAHVARPQEGQAYKDCLLASTYESLCEQELRLEIGRANSNTYISDEATAQSSGKSPFASSLL